MTMKWATAAVIAASAVAVVVPVGARADANDLLVGGCSFEAVQQSTTNGQASGVIGVSAVSKDAAATPSAATVSCWIEVNGVEQPGTRLTASGYGVIAGQAEISFSSTGGAVSECEQVTFADGSSWTAADGSVGVDCAAPFGVSTNLSPDLVYRIEVGAPPLQRRDTLTGGCGFDTNQQQTVTNGRNDGLIYVRALSQDGMGLPSTATVSCWIDVNGVEAPGTRLTVTANGVLAGEQQISFPSQPGDEVTECQQVTFADGSTWTASDGNTGTDCPGAVTGDPVFPPQPVVDLINGIFTWDVDPVACPMLQKLAGTYGPITIAADGDVAINDPFGFVGLVYDCPPYDPVA